MIVGDSSILSYPNTYSFYTRHSIPARQKCNGSATHHSQRVEPFPSVAGDLNPIVVALFSEALTGSCTLKSSNPASGGMKEQCIMTTSRDSILLDQTNKIWHALPDLMLIGSA